MLLLTRNQRYIRGLHICTKTAFSDNKKAKYEQRPIISDYCNKSEKNIRISLAIAF